MVDYEAEALRIIRSHPEGVLQSELWKILDIDSRKCSRIVKKLLDAEQIERVEFKQDGIKTFLLKGKKKGVEPSLILAGGELVPCIGCDRECLVEECDILVDWMYQLAIEELKE
jgi:DNA-binding Lrp family transcriptional regulator